MISFYMFYGGTNWGGLAAPVVYTSYDYGAAIQENRMIGAKHAELKMQGLFLRSARDFRQASFGESSYSQKRTLPDEWCSTRGYKSHVFDFDLYCAHDQRADGCWILDCSARRLNLTVSDFSASLETTCLT
jgi:hypothetical protein